jgi:hypothetical protein
MYKLSQKGLLFKKKVKNQEVISKAMRTRLEKVLNILCFIHSYYSQFEEKLDSTVKRLDSVAREKVKTLIDVGKWTVQKFSIVKGNIDKNHR